MSDTSSVHRILIANRGECASRLIRAFTELQLETIAVFSEADRDAPFVREATHSFHLGASPASESYLRIDRLIEAGRHLGATAIHPGWGFLSENPEFARAVEAEGWIFIGPTAEHARDLGDKVTARTLASKAGVPCTPAWSPEPDLSAEEESTAWNRKAQEIGYPVLVKAVSGGGGKGMRIVRDADELTEALPAARREALSSFNDDRVFLEKFVEPARHIEVQVLGDGKGEVAIIGDRECSLQRRHQKLVEEAPAANIRSEVRKAMQESARSLARSVDYRGAGTVEFLLDASGDHFYFLEMNTRLQVEHPVTEEAFGVDMVKLQWSVANGTGIPDGTDGRSPNAHSIEIRVNAEDPVAGFMPSTGRILDCVWPQGEGIRIDTGVESGSTVTPHYDAMIAKIIVTGSDREDATRKLVEAIEQTSISPLVTSIPLGRDLVLSRDFADCRFFTRSIEGDWSDWQMPEVPEEWTAILNACAQKVLSPTGSGRNKGRPRGTCWDQLQGVRP